MSKKTDEEQEEISEIELSYTLAELPSSQHKAGLAGLYLVIEWLKTELFNRTEISETGLNMKITKQDVRDLFNEIYKPIQIEAEDKSIRTNKKTKEKIQPLKIIQRKEKIEKYIYEVKAKTRKNDKIIVREVVENEINPKSGKSKSVTYYIFEDEVSKKKKDKAGNEIEPFRIVESEEEKTYYIYLDTSVRGSFLCDRYDPESGLWIKLWRDMMWSILRGVDATRIPYKNRLEEYDDLDSIKVWSQLIETDEKKMKADLPSTYFIGAQANNAENISFYDYNKNLFLLHFWPFTAQVYAPKKLKYESKVKDYKLTDNGYAICIPDIIRLQTFCDNFSYIMNRRSNEKAGYRPKESIVYLSQVAGIDSLKRIHDVLKQKLGDSFFEVVYGMDILHCEKEVNNIRIRSNSRIKPDILLEDYVGRLKKLYSNYHFQKQIIENVLNGKYPLSGFYEIFRNYPHEDFFKHGKDTFNNFKTDAITYFNEEKIKGKNMTETNTTEEKIPKTIEMLTYQIIRTYVLSKFEAKYGIIWDFVWDKEKKILWSKVKMRAAFDGEKDNKEKIAKEAFLAIRSRKDKEDFITYFTSTICSVSQRLGEEGYITLVQSLYENESESEAGWQKIRALSMLALSANS
jgi:CRISPR-associated protein Cmx8